jgi:hypothetical protein
MLKSLRSWHLLLLATVAVGFGFLAWWPFDVVHVTTTGVKWTDLVSAIGTPVVIIVSALFALNQLREAEKSRVSSSLFAVNQLREAEKSRYAALAADLTRRWDEPLLASSRQAMSLHGHEEIRDIIKANYTKKATEDEIEAYYTLQALPNFIEGIAVIEDEFEGLSLDLVDRLWGGVIIRAWERWSMAVEWVREESRATAADRAFENFERLAKSLAARREVTAGAEAAQ